MGLVEVYGFDPDPNHLLPLQMLEHTVQDAVLRPPVHPCIDRVPIAESLRQAAPCAAMLGHVENGIEHLQIRQVDVAPRRRKQGRNALVLYWREFHGSLSPHGFR